MTFNVLVIPEDFRKDQYVLKPIVEQIVQSAVGPAKVRVCTDPLLGGISEALKWERISEIIDRYRKMINLFLLIVDRDCVSGRRERLNQIEQEAATALNGTDRIFLAENAWQEVEVWPLAGCEKLPKGWKWAAIRSECHPKETYYDEFAKLREVYSSPYQGRDTLSREAAKNYKRIRSLCTEDVKALEDRIRRARNAQQ
jgi:hypothetical protein